MVRCLLIENDANERQKLSTMVAAFGFECEALSAEKAASSLMENAPDLILMEARDDAGSRELLRLVQYRSETGSAPVVILYAEKPSLEDVGLAVVAGVAHFLAKPFDAELLRFKIEQAGLLHRSAA